MDDLYRALGDISQIRKQMANTTEFRGYGPATLAVTGVLAFAAASVQQLWMPESGPLSHYLAVWITTAAIAAGIAGTQMNARARRIHSGLSNEMIRMAVEQFLPSAGAGVLLTLVIANAVPQIAWTLPGLWQILFSLGVFSSCRFLPKPMALAAVWYLGSGLYWISVGGMAALSPWAMGISFGVGQFLVAAILARNSGEEDYEAEGNS